MYLDGHTIANEMEMAKYYESGTMMQSPESVRYIVIHCTGTKVTNDYTVDHLMRDHLDRGFRTIGYHFYIRRDGTTTQHRKLLEGGLTLNRIIDALLASATRADGMNRDDSEILAHQSRKREWRNW